MARKHGFQEIYSSFEVLDECWVGEKLLGCEVIQVKRIRERLDKLQYSRSACTTQVVIVCLGGEV